MIYRLTLQANFSAAPPVADLQQIMHYIQANAITINPDTENEEPSYYQFEKCHHDENPTLPCEIIDQWSSYP